MAAFGWLVDLMKETRKDILGDVFQGGITYGEGGQFFMPETITSLMGRMVTADDESGERKTIFAPHTLTLAVHDYTDPRCNPEGRRWDVERYAPWIEEGSPHPITVVETDSGSLRVSDGHRRTAAAKMARQSVRAWVSWAVPLEKRDSEGTPIKTRLTVPPSRNELPDTYGTLLEDLKQRIASERVRVVLAANAAMVLLYWDIGQAILERQAEEGWGAKVIDRLSADLRDSFPQMSGLSPRNLKYMRASAQAWPDWSIV
jgi:hypothetical protein